MPKSLNTDEENDYQSRANRLKNAMFDVHNSPPYVGVGKSYLTIINPIKLITAPFIDGLGSGAWDHMLRRTDLILSKSAAFEGTIPICDNSTKKSCDNYYDTAATLFLKKLETDPAFKTVPLNLIAHSMGSIVANNILARHPNLPFQNVVYMGAATRIKDLETVLVPWMRSDRHQKSNFYNLSLDPYRELGENAYYDFLPRGSLLNWIDFTFGEINSFKDRTAGSWWNIARTAEDVFPNPVEEPEINNLEKSLTNLRTRVHLTKFGIGENNGPQAHGDFDDYCFWKRDFWIANETQTHPNCAY